MLNRHVSVSFGDAADMQENGMGSDTDSVSDAEQSVDKCLKPHRNNGADQPLPISVTTDNNSMVENGTEVTCSSTTLGIKSQLLDGSSHVLADAATNPAIVAKSDEGDHQQTSMWMKVPQSK